MRIHAANRNWVIKFMVSFVDQFVDETLVKESMAPIKDEVFKNQKHEKLP